MSYADALRRFCKIYGLEYVYFKNLGRHVVEILSPDATTCYGKTLDLAMLEELVIASKISEEDACKSLVDYIVAIDVMFYSLINGYKSIDVSKFKTLEDFMIWMDLDGEMDEDEYNLQRDSR